MKKVELLAPAGNFDALKGAIKAGADAVYLGGERYGARAYADNFTQDEICEGIYFAHVFGKKVYLTVNTLVKEKELDSLYQFVLPFYEEGLDGVIVQDLGVLCFLRNYFPGLPLHASTQMTVTGSRGAKLLGEEGICRIVPARELSLDEIRKIKSETGTEIEAFIHGAMCYCYSGQCLFSSILGGRSGNRGRCAQPCRLPYEVNGKVCFPLSMRDMCTITFLPELIEAGIDSFKIEGRMKKPAYAAGVSAIYRKYIDLYYEDKEKYRVSREDKDILNALYIRSEIGEGYYKRQNGREMVSLASPAYSGTDERLLADIKRKYIDGKFNWRVTAEVRIRPGKPARLTLRKGEACVTCEGEVVQEAQKQPLTKEKIEEQVKKSGNSFLRIEKADIDMGADDGKQGMPVFMPIRALNELRRNAVSAMEEEIIQRFGLAYKDRKAASFEIPCHENHFCIPEDSKGEKNREIHAFVQTAEQLAGAVRGGVRRVYLDYGLFASEEINKLKESREIADNNKIRYYLATPYIVREKDVRHLEKMKEALASGAAKGVLVRNLESFQFFRGLKIPEKMVLDASLYIWNREALRFFDRQAAEFYLPIECNALEWKEMLQGYPEREMQVSAVIYGRLPMMVTANCLNKTMGKCRKIPGMTGLKDRYGKQFPVYADCRHCYNVIYNSVPLSLHKLPAEKGIPAENYRLDFTTEDERETFKVIRYFGEVLKGSKEPFYKEYTTGHYKRGVE